MAQPGTSSVPSGASSVRFGTVQGRGVLAATIAGSGVAFLDSTVVNVALPMIGRDLGASFAQLQWVVTGYTLTLAAFILVAGALGDRVGRRRVYLVGILGFAVTSALCGVAPSPQFLVAARILQGVAGALLTPGSLALLQASFAPADRGRAIGVWSAAGAVTPAVGPTIGGLLAQLDWRWVFVVNLPVAVVAAVLTVRFVPESRDPEAAGRLDWTGAVLAVLALAGLTYLLVGLGGSGGSTGSGSALLAASGVVAVVAGTAFVWWLRHARAPMIPPELFADRTFAVANLITLAVYAGLGAMFFFLSLQLQETLGYRPVFAGLATLPTTLILATFSERAGSFAGRVGPRLPLLVGPLLAGSGAAYLSFVDRGDSYLLHVLPGVLLFGSGMVLVVAPLTTTVLGAAPDRLAGTASGVNNAVARAAGLLAVAALPSLVGLSAQDYADPDALTAGYHPAMLVVAGLLATGGLTALLVPRHSNRPGT